MIVNTGLATVQADDQVGIIAADDTDRPRRAPRRRLSDPPPDISDAARERLAIATRQAENLAELSGATHLRSLIAKTFGDQFDPAAFQSLRDKFLRDAGDPEDPVEQLMLEQLLLAHFHLMRLHQRASEATSPEAAKVYYAATSRLLGEYRRLVLALRLYRAPVEPKRFTVVKQQNIAAGDQQVALIDGSAASARKDSSLPGNSGQVSITRAIEETTDVPPISTTES